MDWCYPSQMTILFLYIHVLLRLFAWCIKKEEAQWGSPHFRECIGEVGLQVRSIEAHISKSTYSHIRGMIYRFFYFLVS